MEAQASSPAFLSLRGELGGIEPLTIEIPGGEPGVPLKKTSGLAVRLNSAATSWLPWRRRPRRRSGLLITSSPEVALEGGPAGNRGVPGASLLLQPLFSGGGARGTASLAEALEVGAFGPRLGVPGLSSISTLLLRRGAPRAVLRGPRAVLLKVKSSAATLRVPRVRSAVLLKVKSSAATLRVPRVRSAPFWGQPFALGLTPHI